jgi:hypothetical protein
MANIQYKITGMSVLNDIQGEPDYVTNVFWTAIGEETINDKTYFGTFNGNTFLKVDDKEPNFVPYNQLTTEKVLPWVMGALAQEGQDTVTRLINEQIQKQANPAVEPQPAPLPWSN